MDIVGNVVPQYLKDDATDDKGEMARMQSFVGAIAIADLVKTTLGPKGMDKILTPIVANSGPLTVTNDGATILKMVNIDNPAAKILIDISKTQDDEVGDGKMKFLPYQAAVAVLGQHLAPRWTRGRRCAFCSMTGGDCANAGLDTSLELQYELVCSISALYC